MTRRQLLAWLASSTAASPVVSLSPDDDAFLEDLSRRSFLFFVEQLNPSTGLTRDRACVDGGVSLAFGKLDIASLAATGFGLTALCIGVERRWIARAAAEASVLTTLRFLAGPAQREKGWFYHFVDYSTGERLWKCEVSSVDTALALAGVLTVRQYFSENTEIVKLASRIYRAIDFRWMLDGDTYLLSHGWRPENGFVRYRWDKYSEQTILYLMAIGAPHNPIPSGSWHAFTRPVRTFGQYTYLGSVPPVFIHQYSHAWVDYRGRREKLAPHINYFENSVAATRAHREFCMSLAKTFPKSYSADIWGITASESEQGYRAWGGPPPDARIDGTVVPCGPGGSLMFTPDICIPALRAMQRGFGKKIYGRYGFADAFNPTTGWVARDVLGIDAGIILLSAENLRSGSVWRWFMANPEIPKALDAVGLIPEAAKA